MPAEQVRLGEGESKLCAQAPQAARANTTGVAGHEPPRARLTPLTTTHRPGLVAWGNGAVATQCVRCGGAASSDRRVAVDDSDRSRGLCDLSTWERRGARATVGAAGTASMWLLAAALPSGHAQWLRFHVDVTAQSMPVSRGSQPARLTHRHVGGRAGCLTDAVSHRKTEPACDRATLVVGGDIAIDGARAEGHRACGAGRVGAAGAHKLRACTGTGGTGSEEQGGVSSKGSGMDAQTVPARRGLGQQPRCPQQAKLLAPSTCSCMDLQNTYCQTCWPTRTRAPPC